MITCNGDKVSYSFILSCFIFVGSNWNCAVYLQCSGLRIEPKHLNLLICTPWKRYLFCLLDWYIFFLLFKTLLHPLRWLISWYDLWFLAKWSVTPICWSYLSKCYTMNLLTIEILESDSSPYFQTWCTGGDISCALKIFKTKKGKILLYLKYFN